MKTILVLAGGGNSEHAVSLHSGKAVADALRGQDYTVLMADPADGLTHLPVVDAVFPALHGIGGEDGTVQATLEKLGVPFVGADSRVSKLCFDKYAYKQLLRQHAIPFARDELVTAKTIWQSPLTKQPFVLKPIADGSSIGTQIVRDPANVDKAKIEQTLAQYGNMLLEELVVGTELTVGVLGDQALPVIEIIPPQDAEFDYENKYNGATQELCPPVHLSESVQQQAQQLALRIHNIVGIRDLSRTDMIATPTGDLVVLETNTLPGMTNQSLFPKAAQAAGISMSTLIDQLVHMALDRRPA